MPIFETNLIFMQQKTIVNQEKYPIILFFAAILVVFMGLYDPIFDSLFLTILSLTILFTLIYFSFYAVEIVINDTALIRGNRLPFVKKRKKEQLLLRVDFDSIQIRQNEKKYFEIVAVDKNGKAIVFAMLPNRQPALDKLREIEDVLTAYWKIDA